MHIALECGMINMKFAGITKLKSGKPAFEMYESYVMEEWQVVRSV